jgi:hypothetical protein
MEAQAAGKSRNGVNRAAQLPLQWARLDSNVLGEIGDFTDLRVHPVPKTTARARPWIKDVPANTTLGSSIQRNLP